MDKSQRLYLQSGKKAKEEISRIDIEEHKNHLCKVISLIDNACHTRNFSEKGTKEFL